MCPFKRKRKTQSIEKPEYKLTEENIIGVTMNWCGQPTLCFKGGWILPKDYELKRFAKYYQSGEEWPKDPNTGDKLPIALI